ncbi:MAG: hypothetical protein HRT81_17520 [Henriciella sp.]|nr:hypothetical protein [Henriciella sp.]
MKIKYVGDLDSVTVRGVEFPKGKPVEVKDEDLRDKMLAWTDVVRVKRGAKKDDQE